jgi:hypothetical protein
MRRRLLFLVPLAAATFLGACSSDDDSEEGIVPSEEIDDETTTTAGAEISAEVAQCADVAIAALQSVDLNDPAAVAEAQAQLGSGPCQGVDSDALTAALAGRLDELTPEQQALLLGG